ncbi:MAG: hypothetical protein IJ111_07200 [Eggerthellaceae bacterium]|nr:hypothetical protein [Eggerthellaceae bacterium]
MAVNVNKSVRFDPGLAGAIGAWADGAGVDFSEAVRRLCSQGLATWPGSPFAAPAGSSQEVINEIRRAKSEAVTELRIAFEDAVDDLIVGRGGA